MIAVDHGLAKRLLKQRNGIDLRRCCAAQENGVGIRVIVFYGNIVPFLLEDELTKLGANYEKTEDWHPLSVTDGQLITGQNPGSSEAVADALLALLK